VLNIGPSLLLISQPALTLITRIETVTAPTSVVAQEVRRLDLQEAWQSTLSSDWSE
jgi:hypothetical protein